MPEGPSIVILKEELQKFVGKKVIRVEGNSKLDVQKLAGKKIKEFRSWGKHFLIVFDDLTVRIHLMMFGSYRINEEKDATPRLSLFFSRSQRFHFYSCSLKFIEESLDTIYNWNVDIMSPTWDEKEVLKLLRQQPDSHVGDILLDQNVFAGSGNIIKNEVLYIVKAHPLQLVSQFTPKEQRALVKATRDYSQNFYIWKKAYVLRKHWLVYKRKFCPNCERPLLIEWLGKTERKTYYCGNCQGMKRAGTYNSK